MASPLSWCVNLRTRDPGFNIWIPRRFLFQQLGLRDNEADEILHRRRVAAILGCALAGAAVVGVAVGLSFNWFFAHEPTLRRMH